MPTGPADPVTGVPIALKQQKLELKKHNEQMEAYTDFDRISAQNSGYILNPYGP